MRQPIIVPKLTECPHEYPYGYVYIYTNLISGGRYVGKHTFSKTHIDESYQSSGGEHWKNALSKYGWDNFSKEVLFWLEDNQQLSIREKEDILYEKERYFIDLLGTFVNDSDYNESIGGKDLGSGEIHPCYGKHYNCGASNPFYGKGIEMTEEVRRKMSIAKKNTVGEKNPFYGKRHTDEWKAKYRNGANNPSSKPVYQYDLDGNYIKMYSYVKETSQYGFSSDTIGDRCKLKMHGFKNERIPYRGFLFSYLAPVDNKLPPLEEEPDYQAQR